MGFSAGTPAVLNLIILVLVSTIFQEAVAKPLGAAHVELSHPGNQTQLSINRTTTMIPPAVHLDEKKMQNKNQIDGFQEKSQTISRNVNDSITLKPDKRAGGFEGPINIPTGYYLADMIVDCASPQAVLQMTPEDFRRLDAETRYLQQGYFSSYPRWRFSSIQQAIEYFWQRAGECQECSCAAGEGAPDALEDEDAAIYALRPGTPESKCPDFAVAARCMLIFGCRCKEFLFYKDDPVKGQKTGRLHFGYTKGRYLRGPAGSRLSAFGKKAYGAGAIFPMSYTKPSDEGEIFEDLPGGRSEKYFVPGTKEPYYLEGPESDTDKLDAFGRPSLNWLQNLQFRSSQFSKRKRAIETDGRATVGDSSRIR
ncbi:hypothetical protein EYR41_001120 [Orbilia oligospora]|uniref:Uncharacterized protein n=1 Tax=Orbilia oligospora TaxID=2813651 RepID=A0A7C8K638_ORBOL|nr:hypothetical protein TWF751_001684 [Orbilia oligospora]TGJ74072.1 hypothetical protein EYR41_001120 [Orbilia oligospora]